MRTLARASIGLALLTAAIPRAAPPGAGPTLAPGKYVREGGTGVLTLERRGEPGRLHFDIEAVGANAHLCALSGHIAPGKPTGIVDGEVAEECVVRFTTGESGIHVAALEGKEEACRKFCGARAWFDGDYLRPPRGCAPDEIGAARKRFKQLYDRKAFAGAREVLGPVLEDCQKVLDDISMAEVRNDLAIAYHHLGKDQACLEVLAPLRELAAASDQQIREGYPPAEAETYLPVAKATRYNLRVCGRGGR